MSSSNHPITLEKVRSYLKRAGLEVLSVAEAAYFTWQDPRTPRRARWALVSALIYLLSPIDAIPDMLPGGFTDDIGVLLTAMTVAGTVGREHHKQARVRHGLTPPQTRDVNSIE